MAAPQLLMRLAVGAILSLLSAGATDAAGPWKGQVVDRDTGKPIAGAVVVMIWEERSPGVIHPEDEVHTAVEVVTDDDGRFVIPEHSPTARKVFGRIREPYLKIFRRGYGFWNFQGAPYYPGVEEQAAAERRLAQAWKRLAGDGVVIELPRLEDGEKRLSVHSYARPGGVPDHVIPRLLAEIKADRRVIDSQRRR